MTLGENHLGTGSVSHLVFQLKSWSRETGKFSERKKKNMMCKHFEKQTTRSARVRTVTVDDLQDCLLKTNDR